MKTVDGFKIAPSSMNWLPHTADITLNEWTRGKTIKIDVADFYFNPRWVEWKGERQWVADYEMFIMMIGAWVKGDKYGSKGMTKEEALDLSFEIGRTIKESKSQRVK